MRHPGWLFAITMILALLASACNTTAQEPLSPVSEATIAAIAAQTLDALHTREAKNATPTYTAAPATNTPLPTATLAPTRTPIPTLTRMPTLTPPPSATALPTWLPSITPSSGTGGSLGGSSGTGSSTGSSGPAPTPKICNWAEFVKDVTIPDGTRLDPGAQFTKIWRVRNVGTCTWTDEYSFVFVDGEGMGERTLWLPEDVEPGDSVDLAVELVAPEKAGEYQGEWMLRDEDKDRFGTGSGAKQPLVVSIEVKKDDTGVVYDFTTNYCAAEWESDAGDLPCPGDEGDGDGFVLRLGNPNLESRHENEPALWTNPELTKDGYISGTFPPVEIKSGDHFLADIGCLADNPKCDVIFLLRYDTGDDSGKLDDWHEVYDEKVTRIDIDLSSFDGQRVQFELLVRANGPSREDAAFWLVPRIQR
jgi:hypothetical protein